MCYLAKAPKMFSFCVCDFYSNFHVTNTNCILVTYQLYSGILFLRILMSSAVVTLCHFMSLRRFEYSCYFMFRVNGPLKKTSDCSTHKTRHQYLSKLLYQSTRLNIPADLNLQQHRCEVFKHRVLLTDGVQASNS